MKKLAVLLLGLALMVIGALTRIDSVCAQSITKADEKTIADAYIYLLGRALVIRQALNQGKGAALRVGFERAIHDGFAAVITVDADGQHSPDEIIDLVLATCFEGLNAR